MKTKYLPIIVGAALALFSGRLPIKNFDPMDRPTTAIQRYENVSNSNMIISEISISTTDSEQPNAPEPEELWTDFQSFLEWFTRVVLPWLVAFFTSGGAGILIFKIAQMVANQLKVKKVVSESTEELNVLREKYGKTLEAIRSRDELLGRLIETILNAKTRDELLVLFESLPSPADLEASKVTEKIKLKVKKKKVKVSDDAPVA